MELRAVPNRSDILISEERKAIMFEHYETKMPLKDVLELINNAPPGGRVSGKLMREWARKLRLARQATILTPAKIEHIHEWMKNRGPSDQWRELASQLNVNINTVKSFAHKLGYNLEGNWSLQKNYSKLPPELGAPTRDTEIATWDTIKLWALNNRVGLSSTTKEEVITQVNQKRQKYGLPGYVLKTQSVDLQSLRFAHR